MKTLYLITLWWPLFAIGRIVATQQEQLSWLMKEHDRDVRYIEELVQRQKRGSVAKLKNSELLKEKSS